MGAFFVGPRSFYQALNDMSEEERKLFRMSGVERVNQLYGGEELRRLHRIDGRFVNAAMRIVAFGAVISDQLEDGRLVSGIGGQYNFVAMAHALPDARGIIMIRSTRGSGRDLQSNIEFTYGSCSIPRHLRDIIVTEYGIADLRGKSDKEVIAQVINIADSRFQLKLVAQAKKAGKLPQDYKIPREYRNNTPEKIESLLKPFQKDGYLQTFPFGTDFSDDDIELGKALRELKALKNTKNPLKTAIDAVKTYRQPNPAAIERHLKRMGLEQPANRKEKLMQEAVIFALKMSGSGK